MPGHSTRKPRSRKTSKRPEKPYPEFPLYAHPLGYWSAKFNGRILHFGRWGKRVNGKIEHLPYEANWRKALSAHKARLNEAKAGRIRETVVSETPANDGRLTIADLANRFLTSKKRQMESGELSPRSFVEYKQGTDLLVSEFGKSLRVEVLTPSDFESLRANMANGWGPARLAKFIQIIRSVFKYGTDNGLIERPVLFGTAFKKPTKPTMRKHRAASDKKLFTAEEIRQILDAATPQLKAAILLGINAGLGNSDVAGLEKRNIDLKKRWLDFPRIKTGLPRRVPLWPETVASLKVVISNRKDPKDPSDTNLVFINRAGGRMVVMTERSHQDYISSQFRTLLKDLKINGRKGLNFYSLRHTFATIALQCGDRDACRSLMGHAANDMLAEYDETGPNDDRLRKVVDHVHDWLYAESSAE